MKNRDIALRVGKTVGKVVFLTAIFAVLYASVVSANPDLRWNWLPQDLETLKVANKTAGDVDWKDSVTAVRGDLIKFSAYYHCSWENSSVPTERAQNTRVKLTFPASPSNQITVSGSLLSNNVQTVQDSVTINAASPYLLNFENTAEWHHNNIMETVNVSLNQGFIETNLQDVLCDRYNDYTNAGFVVFQARVAEASTGAPTVDIKANGQDGLIRVPSGSNVTLSWNTTNAHSCGASTNWTGIKPASGSETVGPITGTKMYTLSCISQSGQVAVDSVIVEAQAQGTPTVDIKANGSDGPITVAQNSNVTLSWVSSNINTCTASGGWSGNKAVNGSEVVGPITASQTFTITCTGSTVSDSVTVNVSSQNLPTVDLKANGSDGPVLVDYNTAANLTWTSANASACTASNGWTGNKATSGSESTGNLTSSKTYTLTCANQAGSVSDSVTVNVQSPSPNLPSVDLKANGSDGPITVPAGSAVLLSWAGLNASQCNAFGGWSGTKTTSGSETSQPVSASQTFGITCTGPGGTATDSVVVNISGTGVNAGVNVVKTVRNYTKGEFPYKNSTNASPEEIVEFQIIVAVFGNTTASNVVLTDVMPSGLEYKGELTIDGVASSLNITSGINLGNLMPGTTKTIVFRAEIKEDTNLNSIVNTATISGTNITTASASASIIIETEEEGTGLLVEKKAKNITRAHQNWHDVINASPSDKIAFQITVASESTTTIRNITVKDDLPAKMEYKGKLQVDGKTVSGDITDGINIGDLAPNRTKTITFEAQVLGKDSFSFGETSLTNTARAYNADVSKTDPAVITVTKTEVAGGATDVDTGFEDTILQSVLPPLMLSGLGVYVFKEHLIDLDQWFASKKKKQTEYWAKKALKKTSDKIKEKENL